MIEALLTTVDPPVIEPVDWWLCPLLVQLSPGVPGVLDVTAEGDIHLAGEFFWDCPPYADR